MRKKAAILIMMGFLVSLSACAGGLAVRPEPEEKTDAEEKTEPEVMQEAGTEELLNIPEEETGEPEKTIVTYEDGDKYLGVSLPDTWEYRIKTVEDMEKEDGLTICSIEFWPEAFPEMIFELGYCEMFGMCGTGVTIEKMELPGGLTGYRYYEEMKEENTLWLTIIFDQPDNDRQNGLYAIMASPELSAWERIEPEFEKILDSVRIGGHTEE